MSWQDRLVQTDTEKELYNLLEPIFRERTKNGTDCLMGVFDDLRKEEDQKDINKNKEKNTNHESRLCFPRLCQKFSR